MAAFRTLLETLSRRPARAWPDAFVHHGARALLLVALAILIQVLFPLATIPEFPAVEKGMVAGEDMLAEVAFPIPKGDTELDAERADAAAAVAPLFRYDPGAVDTMLARVRGFNRAVDSTTSGGPAPATGAALTSLLQTYGLPSSPATVALLEQPSTNRVLLQSLERTIRAELPRGIMSSVDSEDSPGPQMRIVRDSIESVIARDSVATQSSLYDLATRHLPDPTPAGLADLQRLVLILFFDGSLKLDRQATEDAREQARRTVPAVKERFLRGQRIITAHDVVGDDDIERLNAYRTYLQESGVLDRGNTSIVRQVGQFVLSTLLLSIFGMLLLFYRTTAYHNFRQVSLIALLTAVFLGAAAIIANTATPMELVPIAFPVLVVAMLWDGRMALTLALVTAALLSTLTPFMALSARLLPLLGGAGAALSVRVVRRRSQGLVLGAIIGLAYAIGAIALGMIRTREMSDVLESIMWGMVNGTACSLIAMGFLPLFETMSGITTDQTLLELGDLNRPILKRLSLEASGTYAHSINVANLAEAAARAIDANPILVRVGAYYHDIGKIATPQYFIENQARGRNIHEQMDPHQSAAIVRQHVEDGLRLAYEAKLPAAVRAFIPEHHGTQLIGYFYDLAKKASPGEFVDPADFQYPGPKPQTRETAILMIADSVESAAKALADPTHDRIRELVDRITDSKIAQGQFDEAPLTMRDLHRIKDQLSVTLSGIYHHRIDYPAAALNPVADVRDEALETLVNEDRTDDNSRDSPEQ